MRIFVTGGTGFIGRHAVRALLARGHAVLLLVLPGEARAARRLFPDKRARLISGDLAVPARWLGELRKFRPGAALHLAWEGIPDYGAAASVRNLRASLALLDALAIAGCARVVCPGSMWEYADQKGKRSERDALSPVNALAAAKLALLRFGQFSAQERGTEFVWARLFSVYGPGQKIHSLIPHTVESLRSGERLSVKNPRGGTDFVYVGDVAAALALLIDRKLPAACPVYNIGSGRLTSVSAIVNSVCRELGLAIRLPVPRAAQGCRADIRRIRREVGWKPTTSLADGIRATVRASTRR